MEAPLILVVDDHAPGARMLERELSSQEFRVRLAFAGKEAMRAFQSDPPDLVVLDIVLPDMSGLDVLRAIKADRNVPVIMMTARSGDDVRREALHLGADDFIAKPFSPLHVSETIRFLLSVQSDSEQAPRMIRVGEVEIDLVSNRALRGDAAVRLTRSESLLLEQLTRDPGEPRLYQELLASVWGSDYRDDIDYLLLWMRRLKQKLGDDVAAHPAIVDYHGVGYRLNLDGDTGWR